MKESKNAAAKTVLITGATGFIGSHLVSQLQMAQFNTRIYARSSKSNNTNLMVGDGKWIVGELHDLDKLTFACRGVDTVFHVAGIANSGSMNTKDMIKVNVHGTRDAYLASASAGVKKFVYFSSARAANPERSDYARSKREAENYLFSIKDENHKTQVIILRPHVVYGAGMQNNMIRFIRYAGLGVLPSLPLLDHSFSMVSVGDLCKAALAVSAEESKGGNICYTVTDGQKYTLTRIEEAIYQGISRKKPRLRLPKYTVNVAMFVARVLKTLGTRHIHVGRSIEHYLSDYGNREASAGCPVYTLSPTATFESELPNIIASMETVKK